MEGNINKWPIIINEGEKKIPQSQHMETILMVLTCRCIRSVRQKSLFTAYIVNLQNSPNNADHKT